MNPLRVVYKNRKKIERDKKTEFKKFAKGLLYEWLETRRKSAEKKYGVDLSHMKIDSPK